jgi:hypothetical protein
VLEGTTETGVAACVCLTGSNGIVGLGPRCNVLGEGKMREFTSNTHGEGSADLERQLGWGIHGIILK